MKKLIISLLLFCSPIAAADKTIAQQAVKSMADILVQMDSVKTVEAQLKEMQTREARGKMDKLKDAALCLQLMQQLDDDMEDETSLAELAIPLMKQWKLSAQDEEIRSQLQEILAMYE